MLLGTQGKYAESQPSCERALAIREGALGMDHPDTITSRVCVAYLYARQGLLDKAAPSLEKVVRSLDRAEPNHASKAAVLLHWALRLVKQEKCTEAIPLLESVLSTRAKIRGESNPRASIAPNNLQNTPTQVGRRGRRSWQR